MFAVPVLCVLLMVTVIGIPIGILLPFVHVAAAYAGQLAASYVLGCKLTRRRIGEGSAMGPMMAGTLLIAVFFGVSAFLWMTPGFVRTVALFLSLVGLSLLAGLTAIGTGAFLLSRAGTRPVNLEPESGTASTIPASPEVIPAG